MEATWLSLYILKENQKYIFYTFIHLDLVGVSAI